MRGTCYSTRQLIITTTLVGNRPVWLWKEMGKLHATQTQFDFGAGPAKAPRGLDQALFWWDLQDTVHFQAGSGHLLLAGAVGPLGLTPLPGCEDHEDEDQNKE